jgi:thiol-disulfide isomerase/thioredoxin
MKKTLIIIFLLGKMFSVESQPQISGKITPSGEWSKTLYILKLNQIDLNYYELVDSIRISNDGYFNYSFKADTAQGLLYKITLPPRGENFRSSIGGVNENYFILSIEDSDSLTLKADSDSLYYSLKIKGGTINEALLAYRDHSKPFFELSKAWNDSLERNPDQIDSYNKRFTPLWMDLIEEFKKKVIQTLDTADNVSVVLAGLCYLNSAYLGILPGDIIKKYLPKISHLDIPLAKNTIELAGSVETNRTGLFLPNIEFKDRQGNPHSLDDVAAKVTVIDFWASWCKPCREANKTDLPELYKNFRNDPNKQLISVSIDGNRDKWRHAIDADKVTWPQYVDESRAFANLLSVSAVPLYLVLDENKKIVYETISTYHLKQFLSNMGKN